MDQRAPRGRLATCQAPRIQDRQRLGAALAGLEQATYAIERRTLLERAQKFRQRLLALTLTIYPEQGFVLLSSLPACLITSLALLKVLLTH